MREKKTLSILLRKTLLPNDDVILEFLTLKFGKISVFAKKFAKSRKRLEIDFFRLIELEIFEGRHSKSLKSASTFSVFHNFSRDFQSSQIGFKWLDILSKILPAEEINTDLFKTVIDLFTHYTVNDFQKWNAYFQIQMLNKAGFWPKFDKIRDNIYFNPLNKKISREKTPETIAISNLERQLLEFLRRADLAEFSNKKNNLPQNFAKIFEVLEAIEKFK